MWLSGEKRSHVSFALLDSLFWLFVSQLCFCWATHYVLSQDYLELLFSVHTNERSIYGKIDHFLGPLVLRAKLLPVQLHCARFFFSAVSIEVEVHDIIWQLLYYSFFHSNKIYVEIKNGPFQYQFLGFSGFYLQKINDKCKLTEKTVFYLRAGTFLANNFFKAK